MNIVFLGPIASGKGTQAEYIAKKYNFKIISVGDLLRKRRLINDEIGNKIASLQRQGLLVDDEITVQVLEEELKKCNSNDNILFDGFPRSIKQAQLLDDLLEKYGRKVNRVINFEIDDKAIIDRIGGRLICDCGETYHILHKKPAKEGICDKCGKKLYQRDDDTNEGISKRLQVYHTYVVPVIDFYKERHLLQNVNALQEIESVSKDIDKVIGGE